MLCNAIALISSEPSAPKPVRQPLPIQRSPGKVLDAVVCFSRPQLHGEYRVLCVDDSTTIQMMMKKIFSEDSNCKQIEFAMNGREAREKLDKQKFDLVTLDIHMPEVSGIAFLEKLYNVKKDPPVLMVASVDRTDIALASKSLLLGAFDYVEKPEMNNLQKSIDEILMKAKMALRHKADSTENTESSFDKSIAQKIVVPDASQCLRIVVGSSAKLKQLEQIIKGQEDEYRSPATLIIWKDSDELMQLQTNILDWSAKKINRVHEKPTVLKPNQFYLFKAESADGNLDSLHFKSISMQVLDHSVCKWNAFKTNNLQILFDETLSRDVIDFEQKHKVRIHDVTPSTSFPSLSVEFFANVRKLAA